MKEKWISPKTVIEEFVPNEYVALCWGVGCYVSAANDYEKSIGNGHCTHDAAHCGFERNQVIRDTDGDNIPDKMIEIGTDGLGDLTCFITEGGNISSIKPGNFIRWETRAGDGRVWHHQGTVRATDPQHPNAS